jgi:multidrug/hemolysin transport system ATP-binding protein
MEPVIEVKGLTKRFKAIQAVKGITFQVERGSLFAFLGTNGAGKSTTIEILCTLQEKTAGEVVIDGHQLGSAKSNDDIRKSIGVVFQQSLLDDDLTVFENIWHRGKFYRLTKRQLRENYQFVSDTLSLPDIEHKKYGQLSGGQKRRADIARAIIHKPQILFLDEPTTGLDPKTRKMVWSAIEQLRQESKMTIFLTTHYMEEAVQSDNIVIMKEGQIIAQGSPQWLKEQFAKDQLLLVLKDRGEDVLQLMDIPYRKRAESFVIEVESTLETLPILQKLEGYISSFEVIKGSLDDVFIEINEGGEIHDFQFSAAQ